jgi:predicted RNA binding protein YcfA (HicA-like mRNA interferase family)
MLIRKIKQLGFEDVRQKGSHIRFIHPDGRKTTVPDHGNRDVPQGLLIKIVHYDLKIDIHEFFKDG